jgi:hypothetical protein
MHGELVVPGLFAARAGRRFAALELLLARGRSRSAEAKTLEDWLKEAFEIEAPGFPAGALTLLGRGGNPGAANWTRADPVHLRVMRDHLILLPAQAFDLSQAEADALCAALNGHFEGMNFSALEPRRWCASVSFSVETSSALQLAGQEAQMPREAAAFLNEAQMVLHEHPVNEAREARGEPPVNSVWLWGAGHATRAHCPWQSVAADDPAALGAARLAHARHRALPRSGAEWLERLPQDGRHLAVLDALRAPLALGEPINEEIEALERDWFAPLLAALRAGHIGMVSVHVPDGEEALSFETIRADLRRFWRLARPIEHYV